VQAAGLVTWKARLDATPNPLASQGPPVEVLLTGASGGIGRAMLASLQGHPRVSRLFTVSRRAGQDGTQASRGGLDLAADLSGQAGLDALGDFLAREQARLDLVINAAGLLHGPSLQPEKALEQLDLAALQQSFAVNAFLPILLARTVMPWLRQDRTVVLASLSARVGSISDNRLGGWYAYRAAKAAQNQLFRTLAIEWRRRRPRACCVVLHPGTVDTALSAPFQRGVPAGKLFSPAQSAAHLLALIAGLEPADSGRFLAWDGRDIPW